MKKIFYLMMLILLLGSISSIEYHYEIQITNNESGLSITGVGVELGETGGVTGGNYTLEIKSFDFKTLYRTYFQTKDYMIIEGDLGDGYFDSKKIEYDLEKITLFAPYYENAKEIIIYDGNSNEVARRDVSEYSRQKLAVKGEGISGEEGAKDKGTEKEKGLSDILGEYWWILLIVLLVLIIALFYSLKKKKQP